MSRYNSGLTPRFISIRGVSENTWERKRPIWEGDQDRERVPPPKKSKTKHGEPDGDAVYSKAGDDIVNEDGVQES
jgi:hypothetical protein